MAYNTKKGSQHSGDIQYEGDPNDTQIDFENDSIGLKTGGATRVLVTDTGLSGSAGLQTVGAAVLGNTLSVTGAITTAQFVTSAFGYQGRTLDIGGESQFKVDLVGVLSSSNIVNTVGSISSSGDLAVSGAVHATNFYGDGSGITGITPPVANYNESGDNRIITSVDSNTIQGEANLTFDDNDLKVIGANISASHNLNVGKHAVIGYDGGGNLNVSGSTIITNIGSNALTVNAGGWDAGGQYAISGSGRIRGYSMHAGNNQIHLGNDESAVYWPAGEAYILNQGHYSGSKSLVVGGPISGSGTLFMSGAISGAAELQAVGATTPTTSPTKTRSSDRTNQRSHSNQCTWN